METIIKDHPISNLFPLMTEKEISLLSVDISENGQREPIVILDGMILDGRNRYRACIKALVQPKSVIYAGKDPLKDVLSWNLHRRHLNESQRAIVAARLANMQHGGDRKSDQSANLPLDITQPEAAAMLNISSRSLRTAKQIIRDMPDKVAAIESGEKTITAVRRESKREAIEKIIPETPSGKYRVLYADPPWKYGDGLTEKYGPAKFHYPSMTITELCELPVKDIAEDNSVLFLWVTSPLLGECWPIIKAWGYKYKTSFVWDKIKHNMGHYNSVRHEFLLICTRGSCLPDIPELIDSVQSIERLEHSQKPEEFRGIIDRLYPTGKRIELFAREEHEKWEAWGNEV